MRGRRLLARGLLLTCFLALGAASAVAFLRLDLDARLRAAHDAVLGTVVAVEVESRQGEPWTVVSLRIERAWLRDGELQSSDSWGDGGGDLGLVEAAFWGGHAPGLPGLLVAGMPAFEVGERIIWLLHEPGSASAAATVGVTQGVWRERDGAWLGDDGLSLGLSEDGRLALGGAAEDEDLLSAAIAEALERAGGRP